MIYVHNKHTRAAANASSVKVAIMQQLMTANTPMDLQGTSTVAMPPTGSTMYPKASAYRRT